LFSGNSLKYAAFDVFSENVERRFFFLITSVLLFRIFSCFGESSFL